MELINKHYYKLVSILHVGLACLFVKVFGHSIKGDSEFYIKIGEELLKGNWFDPMINWKFGPSYPLFLSLISAWAEYDIYWVTIVQSVLFCVVLYLLVNSLFSDKISKQLFLILCLVPEFIFTNSTLMSESISASLFMIIFYLIILSSSKKRFFIASVLSGILILCRFEFVLLLATLFLISLIFKKINSIKDIMIWSFVPFLFLSLNTFKNYKTYNEFNPSSYGSGTVIYGGNNLNLDGSWHPHIFYEKYIPAKHQVEYLSYVEEKDMASSIIKLDSLYKAMALEAWDKSFTDQLKLIPVKFLRIFLLPANLDIFTMSIENNYGLRLFDHFTMPEFSFYGKLKHAFSIIPHLILIFFMVYGLCKSYYLNNEIFVCIISVFIVGGMFYTILGYGLPRFNAPLLPFLSLSIGFVFRKT